MINLIAIALLLATFPLNAQPADLYAFDNGAGRDQKLPLFAQADLAKRTGYAGIAFTGTERIPEFLSELDARGLHLSSIYVHSYADGRQPAYDPAIPRAIEQLKGRATLILLTIQAPSPEGDAHAIAILRELAPLAARSGLKICLYPHFGFHVARVEHAYRLAEASGQPNVGVAFNLCHWLRSGDEPNLAARLKEIQPRLLMVNVNGADHTGDWDRLIRPLDEGEFDLLGFLRAVRATGFKGLFGLQCYQVKGDIEVNLKRSMAAWRTLQDGLQK